MSEGRQDLGDEVLGRRLHTDLPRHTAPPQLRATVAASLAPRPAVGWWLGSALGAAAATLVLALAVVLPLLARVAPADPIQRLAHAVVTEHTRVVLWGPRVPEVTTAGTEQLSHDSGIALLKMFSGDERLTMVGAEPVYVDQQRGAALHYRDSDGHHVTYLVFPAPGLRIPPDDRRRVPIDGAGRRWRPALVSDSGFSVWVWKQGDLACFIVSDMVSQTDLAMFKDYFVRLRTTTEPKPAY